MKTLFNYSPINRPLYKWGALLIVTLTSVFAAIGTGLFIPFSGFFGFQIALLPTIVIIILAIWLMPKLDYCYESIIERLLIFYVIFICIWPPYVCLIPLPGKIWTPPARILSFILLFFLIINFSVSKYAKSRLKDLYKTHPLIMYSFTMLLGLQVLSIIFAPSPVTSLTFFAKYFTVTSAIFLAVITTIRNSKTLLLMTYIVVPIVCYYVGMAFFQSNVEQNLFGLYLPDWMIGGGETISSSVMRPIYRNGEYRVNGISITSLEFAELFVYMTPFLLYFIMEGKNFLLKLIATVVLAFAFIGVLKTGSRLGNVGLLFGAMTYIMIWSLRQWLQDGRSIIGPAIVTMYIAGIGAFVTVLAASTRIRGMIFGDSSTANSSDARLHQLTDGIPIIATNPIFGFGIGQGATKLNYRNPAGYLTIDSYWLSVAIETGLTGLVCFLIFFGSLIWYATKLYIYDQHLTPLAKLGAALASTIACFLLIKLVLSQTFNNSLIYFLAGVTLIIVHKTIKIKETTAPHT